MERGLTGINYPLKPWIFVVADDLWSSGSTQEPDEPVLRGF
jgi:hypothetical protein